MEIVSQVGRVVLLTSADEFTTGGRSFVDLSKAIADRCGFAKFPKTLEEWQAPNGAEFLFGRWDGIEIPKLVIYARGVSLDTKFSTDESDRILGEMLGWAAETLKVGYRSRPIHRRLYQSEIVFISDMSLNATNPVLSLASDILSRSVSEQWKQMFSYEVVGLSVGIDESNVKFSPGLFRLERRQSVPFGDKAYYSLAPVQTEQHKVLLQQIETALMSRDGTAKP